MSFHPVFNRTPEDWFIFYINFMDRQSRIPKEKLDPKLNIWDEQRWEIIHPDTCIGQRGGCYIIYSLDYVTYKKELLYIGTSENLKKRLSTHEVFGVLGNILPKHTLLFSRIFYIEGKGRFELEEKLIKTYKPPINRAHNRLNT